jgi:AcrR family transcriptional regulator
MVRVSKAPEERRLEIIETSDRLFRERGYTKVSVEAIIREIGVAKGTFYYYFKSKDEILGAIVENALHRIVDQVEQVADLPETTAMAKFELLLSDTRVGDDSNDALAEMMHMPENRELHELTNIQTVLRLSPLFARIVEQGNREGSLATPDPLETMQFLLTGAQFLLDGGMFGFSPEEIRDRRKTTQRIIELSLGAAPGSFQFMNAKPLEV